MIEDVQTAPGTVAPSAVVERFHALDATRAFALMLGVVFHAAWSFVPRPFGAPMVDASASEGFAWFFYTAHLFRMQLFFLIAGFFAHLLYHRRGPAGFARHRLLRVGVPLVVGWFVLYPLIVAAWVNGANASGQNLLKMPLPQLFSLMYGHGLLFVSRPSGGLFGIAHLWFLYYLLWLYALTLALRFVSLHVGPVGTRLRAWADDGVARAMHAPGFLLWLTLGVGLLLWPMTGWFGVDTPAYTLVPSVPVLLFYGSFFVLGWLLHRQPGLLSGMVRHWRWQLVAALALSVPLFVAFRAAQNAGVGINYPAVEATQIHDWPAFLTRLQSAGRPDAVSGELASLWSHLPTPARDAILGMSALSGPDQRTGVATAITSMMVQPGMFSAEPIPTGSRPPPDVAQRAVAENRLVLERLFADSLAGDPRTLRWYRPAKLVYSLGYALGMWLLVFGTLGFFQARWPAHSPAWRYVADSSYWIYLVHLPLVPFLQVWMAPWPWPGAVKFPLLLVVSFTLLFASYHYLVRSTAIGRMLNGQSHPFVAWPFRQRAGLASRTGA
jgi:peptidoglycan/LPS O-acetylase OafA/YrhL